MVRVLPPPPSHAGRSLFPLGNGLACGKTHCLMATFQISPLVSVDANAEQRPVEELVDLVHAETPVAVPDGGAAVELLLALGADRVWAEGHVRYCVTGQFPGCE